MKTRIYGTDLNEMLEADYPDSFKDGTEPISERTFSSSLFLGEGTYKEVFFEGIHIGYGDFRLANTTLLQFESEFETVEMHFALNGIFSTRSDCFGKPLEFAPGSHNILYCDHFHGLTEWSAKLPLRIFEINMAPSFFAKYLPDGNRLFENFRKAMKKSDAAILSRNNYPITLEMYSLINEIIRCRRKGIFKRIFLESKIIALLLLQLEQISALETTKVKTSLGKRDIEKMYAVKELLDANFRHIATLIDLARQVGTNEFTLKKGFKELFGTSVYNYWKALRLQTAKTMLLEEGLSIKEVSRKIGYKNPQHFTTAFKKRFGVVPSQIKNF